jgi:hypothetical protein
VDSGQLQIPGQSGLLVVWLQLALIPAALIPLVLVSTFLTRVPWATGLWSWPARRSTRCDSDVRRDVRLWPPFDR